MHYPTDRITHTTAFVTPVVEHWLEREILQKGNVLFHETHLTFYLRLYGVGLMVEDHSDSKRENPLPPFHMLLFPITSKGYFIYTIPKDMIAHTMTFVNPTVDHWLKQEIVQWVHHDGVDECLGLMLWLFPSSSVYIPPRGRLRQTI